MKVVKITGLIFLARFFVLNSFIRKKEIMKKLVYTTFSILATVLVLGACQKEDSSDVNQDKVYTAYELFYNQNSDKTVAIARLRFGGPTGTLLEATDPASVTYNGDPMPYSVLYSGHAKEYAGKITGGTFIYTNTENVSFSNTVPSMDTIGYPSTFTEIVKSQANTLTWEGNALSSNERVNLFIGSWTWGQDALFFATGNGTTDLVMGTNALANLAEGTSNCYLDRVNEVPVSQGTSEGGVIRTRYRPTNIQVNVIP